MKNLFEFATKELSQDAFLRWFLESWEDQDIRPHVIRFLEKATGLSDLKTRLTSVRTTAQAAHIDILCDFALGDEKHLLVIEDKTMSRDHNDQLNRYTKEIEGRKEWKHTQGKVHLLYYKTSFLEGEERNSVTSAKGCLGAKWVIWDLSEITEFFSGIKNETSSEILKQYAEHVMRVKKDLTETSTLPISEWTFNNWKGYFDTRLHESIAKYLNERYGEQYFYGTYFWGYQGRYVSINHFINPCKRISDRANFIPKLDLEIFIRPWQDEITATVHPVISEKEGDKRETWKCSEVYNEKLRALAAASNGAFSPLRTKQCVARFGKKRQKVKKKSGFKTVGKLTDYLLDLIISFHDVFEEQIELDESIIDYEQVALVNKKEEE